MTDKLEKILCEEIENVLLEETLKAKIKSIIKEEISLGEVEEADLYEKSKKSDTSKDKDDDKSKDKGKDKKKKNKKFNDDGDKSKRDREIQTAIETYFKNPGVNKAQYAYKLAGIEPVEGTDTDEMKNARSLFMKKLYHELNDSGYPYEFTPEESLSIYSEITSQQLHEVKKWMKILNA